MSDAFSKLHPVINFVYFFSVILFSMIFMHPMFLIISLVCSFIYSIYLNGIKAVKFNFLGMLPLIMAITVFNPIFNHEGATSLMFINDHAITLESIMYGLCSGIMFAAVIVWFSCYNKVMTSDKFIYLFGCIIPSLSLVLSMTLRFVPKFRAQIKIIGDSQKCIGRGASQGTIIAMIKNGVKIISIMVTWALENAIETSDSMRARGYGLKGRTSFSIYRFDSRDKTCLIILLILTSLVIVGAAFGFNTIEFFPYIKYRAVSISSMPVYLIYSFLCLFPVILDAKEDIKWRYLQSEI